MHKTTVYLPDELKRQLTRAAAAEATSEAALIRDAISRRVGDVPGRAPRLPLVDDEYGDPGAAARVDDLLGARGFGR